MLGLASQRYFGKVLCTESHLKSFLLIINVFYGGINASGTSSICTKKPHQSAQSVTVTITL